MSAALAYFNRDAFPDVVFLLTSGQVGVAYGGEGALSLQPPVMLPVTVAPSTPLAPSGAVHVLVRKGHPTIPRRLCLAGLRVV